MGQTADQVRQIADLFTRMSETVDNYRNQHFESLTPDERLRLEQLFQQLCDVHDQFTALAIEETLAAMQSGLDQVVTATGEAQRALQHLTRISEIASLVSAAVGLGADITTGDYGAIPQALKDIVQALPKKTAPPSPTDDKSS